MPRRQSPEHVADLPQETLNACNYSRICTGAVACLFKRARKVKFIVHPKSGVVRQGSSGPETSHSVGTCTLQANGRREQSPARGPSLCATRNNLRDSTP